MEAKLAAYRNKQRRKIIFNNIKTKLLNMVSFHQKQDKGKKDDDIAFENINEKINKDNGTELNEKDNDCPELINNWEDNVDDDDVDTYDDESLEKVTPKEKRSLTTYFIYFVYFLFWATCYAIAIEIQFGIVYLLFSALFGVYFNTRTGPKDKKEISAYSVFNENCHSIDGTLKAEQFEREIRYGPGSVR